MTPIFGRPPAAAARARRGAARGLTAVALSALLIASSGCSRGPHHPDWVIHSAIEVVGPPPAGGYRLVFPYIVGDFYGSPNTGDFVAPSSRTAGAFTLDLNRTLGELESELGPTDFSLHFLKIVPHDARLARLTPVALQLDGIEPVGPVEWVDAGTRRPLMLVYIDREARIAGSFSRGGQTVRYDVRASKPGYVWIGAVQQGQRDILYTAVPSPQHLVLTITAKR